MSRARDSGPLAVAIAAGRRATGAHDIFGRPWGPREIAQLNQLRRTAHAERQQRAIEAGLWPVYTPMSRAREQQRRAQRLWKRGQRWVRK